MSTARYRTRSEPVQSAPLYVDFTSGGTDTSVGPFPIRSSGETMSDHVTPSFHRRLAAGEIVNNPCVYTKTTLDIEGSGFGTYTNGSTYYTLSGPLTYYRVAEGNWSDVSLVTDHDSVIARSKLLALNGIDSTPYAFGEDILSVGETLRFLRNPVQSLVGLSKAFRKLRNFNVSRGLNLAEASAQAWLTYRFAFRPLVKSTADALEALDSKIGSLPVRLSSHGSDTNDWSISKPNNGVTYGYSRVLTESLSARSSVLYEVSNPVRDVNWKLGLRGKDIPETLWAIVPLSFMIDRVLDISSMTRAMTNLADPSVKILTASSSFKLTRVKRHQLTRQTNSGWTQNVTGEMRVNTLFTYNRSVWLPSVFDTLPRLTPKNLIKDATSITDLVALIVQNLRR